MSSRTTFLRRDPAEVEPWAETCGAIRCLIEEADGAAGEVHHVEIHGAKLHYHKQLTETYYILECDPDSQIQLNDIKVSVKPGMCIMIRPGVRHRAIGKMKVLIVVIPKFDPDDEWLVDLD